MSASLISSVVFSKFILCRVYDLQLGVACSLTLLVVLSAASTGWSFMAVVSLHLCFSSSFFYGVLRCFFIVLKVCLRSAVTDRQTDRQADRDTVSDR